MKGRVPRSHFGIENLLRYAFGMDALRPEREKLPQLGQLVVMEDGQSQTYLTLTYTRRTDDVSLIFIAQASDDLFDWLPFSGVEETVDDGTGETETVTLIDSETMDDHTLRFLRLRVER